jgi:hypothetical protein
MAGKTVKIRMKRSVAGVTFSFRRGKEYELPEAQAKEYVAAGHAEHVTGRSAPKTPSAKPDTKKRVVRQRTVAKAPKAAKAPAKPKAK